MPGFMDSYLQDDGYGTPQEDPMFDMHSGGQGGYAMPQSPGQDPRKKNRWAAYFQQMLGKGGQIDPQVEEEEKRRQMQAGSGAGAGYRASVDPMQSGMNSSLQQGQAVGKGLQGLRGLFG